MSSTLSINEYFALAGSNFSNDDARIIGPELQELAKAGDVTPSQVVDAARSTNSPLHGYFEWDDERAAHLYRCDQADDMIRTIKVKFVASGHERVTRAYNVRTAPSKPIPRPEQRHLPVPREGGADALAAAALRDLDAWAMKYQSQIALYGRFAEAITPVMNQIAEMKDDFRAGHLSGPLRKAVEAFLDWEASYGRPAAARLYGEHLNYVLEAIKDVRATFGPTQAELLNVD